MNWNVLNLYNIASLIEGPGALLKKGFRVNARQNLIEEIRTRYDRLVGRWDSVETIPGRVLYGVEPDDHDILRDLGAEYQEITQRWVVPEHIPLGEDFSPWFTPVPEDLRDKAPRMTRTKDGLPIEGYKDMDDEVKGGDSTALPIMYAMLPVIAALSSLLAIWGLNTLAGLTALLAIPYIWTISQSEGPREGFVVAILCFLIPLTLSSGLGMGLMGLFGSLGAIGATGPFVVVFLLFLVAFLVLADGDKKHYIGGSWEGFKSALKWTVLVSILMVATKLLEGHLPWLSFALPFGMACVYPMIYSEREFNMRAEILAPRGKTFNLATQGGLGSAHVDVRRQQAEDAVKDTSPLYEIGVALGHLTKKEYGYAPDRGCPVRMSVRDACSHTLTYGSTGVGKTSTSMRKRIKDIHSFRRNKIYIGCYIDCGKGSLTEDVSGGVDILIETGKPYAFFEGLDARGVTKALMSRTIQTPNSDPIWANGARTLVDHATHMLQALIEHEKRMRLVAVDRLRAFSLMQDKLDLRLLSEPEARDEILAKKGLVEEHYKDWYAQATADRKWFWNPDGLDKILQHINQVRRVENQWQAGASLMEWVRFLGFKAGEDRVVQQPETIHKDIGGGYLDKSIEFLINVWPAYAEEQRSSFMLNVQDRLQPLMRGVSLMDENGIPWFMLETGLDVTRCMFGEVVGVSLPVEERDGAGLVISALNKEKIYLKVKERFKKKESEWMAEGGTPVLLLWDEVQLLVTEDDLKMLPIMRSAWIQAYWCTQGFDSLVQAFGSENQAVNFANTFQSLICLKSSPETYEYMIRRLGTALVTTFQQQTLGIDFAGAVDKYLDSPFNDEEHPNRAALKKIERLGGARFHVGRPRYNAIYGQKNEREEDAKTIGTGILVNIHGNKEVQELVRMDEFEALLAGRSGKAFVYINRAGAPRVDLVQLPHVSADELRRSSSDMTISLRGEDKSSSTNNNNKGEQ